MEENIRWQVTDPLGNEIVLRESTFQEHIDKDHNYADAIYRKSAEMQVKNALVNPHLIFTNRNINNRNVYCKLIPAKNLASGEYRLKFLKVVVDTDREPNEIATWVAQSKVKEIVLEEWIIYGK